MPIICKCGSVDNYRAEPSGPHLKAICNACGAYIKFLPTDVPRLYVGRYKGRAIAEIDDLPYLEWALKTLTNTERVAAALRHRISELQYLAK